MLVLILCSSRLDASTYSPFHTESPSQAPQRTLPLKLSPYGQAPQPTLPLTLSSPGQAPLPILPLTLRSPGHVPKPILFLILCSSRLDASTYSPSHTESLWPGASTYSPSHMESPGRVPNVWVEKLDFFGEILEFM